MEVCLQISKTYSRDMLLKSILHSSFVTLLYLILTVDLTNDKSPFYKSGCCPLNCTHVWNYEQCLARYEFVSTELLNAFDV